MNRSMQPKKNINFQKSGKKARQIYDRILAGRAQGKHTVIGTKKIPEEVIPQTEEEANSGDYMSYHYRIMDFSKRQNEDNN